MSWVAVAVGGPLVAGLAGNMGKEYRAKRDAKQKMKLGNDYLYELTQATQTERDGVNSAIGNMKSQSDRLEKQANMSYLDTTEGMSLSSMIDQRSTKNKNRLSENINMMGGTTESFLAGLNSINQSEGDSMRDLVSGADQRRNQLRSQQSGLLSQILGGQNSLLNNKTSLTRSAYGMGTDSFNQSQARNDGMTQNVSNSFSSAAMLGLQGG